MKTQIIHWFKQRTTRNVPLSYLNGYRRLGDSSEQINQHVGKCYSCRNAVAFVTWWCDVVHQNKPCEWEPAYTKSELTKLDLLNDFWLRLPDDVVNQNKS